MPAEIMGTFVAEQASLDAARAQGAKLLEDGRPRPPGREQRRVGPDAEKDTARPTVREDTVAGYALLRRYITGITNFSAV